MGDKKRATRKMNEVSEAKEILSRNLACDGAPPKQNQHQQHGFPFGQGGFPGGGSRGGSRGGNRGGFPGGGFPGGGFPGGGGFGNFFRSGSGHQGRPHKSKRNG